MPVKGIGTLLKWNSVTVGQVLDVTPGGEPVNVRDNTTLDDTVMQKRTGRRKLGDLTFDIMFNQDAVTHASLRADWYSSTPRTVLVTFPTGSINDYTFTGQIMNFTISADDDGDFKGQLQICKLTKPTRT